MSDNEQSKSETASRPTDAADASDDSGSITPEKVTEKPAPTPDVHEGLDAWLRVLGAFLLFVLSWGPATAYGAFQSYYQGGPLAAYSSSSISWIGSIQTFLLITLGVFAGPLFDKGYVRSLMTLGCILIVLSFMFLSLSTEYYQILLTQGIMYGLGSGLAYVPSLALVSVSFGKNRAVAIGLTTSGGSVGGVIFPILFRRLQPRIGFPWTVRVIGFLQLGLAAIALALLLRVKIPTKPPRKIFQPKAFTEPAFALFSAAVFFQFLAYWIPLFFIPTFATARLGLTEDLAFYLLAVSNAASMFGRIIPAFIAQKIGAMPVVAVATAASVAIIFSWIAVTDVAGFAVFCILWGLFSGVFISADPVIISVRPISPNLNVLGTRLGMVWMCGGIGVLIGTPIAGALVDLTVGNFVKAQAFGGAMMAAATICLLYPWLAIHRTAIAERK